MVKEGKNAAMSQYTLILIGSRSRQLHLPGLSSALSNSCPTVVEMIALPVVGWVAP